MSTILWAVSLRLTTIMAATFIMAVTLVMTATTMVMMVAVVMVVTVHIRIIAERAVKVSFNSQVSVAVNPAV